MWYGVVGMLNIGLHVGAVPSLVTSQCTAEYRGAGGYTGSSCIRRWRTLAVHSRVYTVYPQSLTPPLETGRPSEDHVSSNQLEAEVPSRHVSLQRNLLVRDLSDVFLLILFEVPS